MSTHSVNNVHSVVHSVKNVESVNNVHSVGPIRLSHIILHYVINIVYFCFKLTTGAGSLEGVDS